MAAAQFSFLVGRPMDVQSRNASLRLSMTGTTVLRTADELARSRGRREETGRPWTGYLAWAARVSGSVMRRQRRGGPQQRLASVSDGRGSSTPPRKTAKRVPEGATACVGSVAPEDRLGENLVITHDPPRLRRARLRDMRQRTSPDGSDSARPHSMRA